MDPISTLGAMTGIANTVSSLGDNERQQGYTLDMMEKQYEINKKALKDQEASQLRMFEATGYGARVAQMKKAGLNPGLIYSTGAGAGGVTGNISAPSVGLGQAPNIAANTANRTAAISMTLQMQKLQSEIEVNKSIAEANKADAASKTASVPKIEAETQNLKSTFEMIATQIQSERIKQAGWSIDNDFNKIRTEIAENTKFADIERIASISREANISFMKSIEEWKSARAQAKVDQATIDQAIEQYNLNIQKTAADIIVAKSQGKVNQERAEQIVNEIAQDWMNAKANASNANTNADALQNKVWETLQNNGAAMDRVETQALYNIIQTIIGAGILKSGGKDGVIPVKGFGGN